MEEDPAEHLHTLGKRTSEDHRSIDKQSGNGSLRWPAADRLGRGVVPEAYAKVYETSNIPKPETGERLGCPEIPAG